METLNLIARWAGSLGCLFVASYLVFSNLVWVRFYDYGDKRKVERRWRNDNRAGRLGGIGIFIFLVVVMNMWSGPVVQINNFPSMLILFFLFMIGVIDDVFFVDWLFRLALYIVIAFVLAASFNPGLLSWVFYSFVVFFFINSFNMFDNMDLVAPLSSIQILVFSGIMTADIRFAVLALLLLPFVYFNGLGKIMMGDCGSTVLGALFGVLAVWMLSNGIAWYSVLLVFIVPVVDTSFVIVRRLVEKRKPWIGGVDHLTHALDRKVGAKNTVTILFIFGLLSGTIGVILR